MNGDYPEIVKTLVAQKSRAGGLNQSRLPTFTEEEKKMIKGTHDYFAYNTYSTYLVENRNYTNSGPNGTTPQSIETDQVLHCSSVYQKRIQAFKIRIQAFKIRIQAFKIRIQAFKIRIQAFKIRIQALKIRIQAFKIRIQAFKLQ